MPDPSVSGPAPRAGARRGARAPRTLRPRQLLVGLAALIALVAWGFLVWAAIWFGRSARRGDTTDWWFLAAATVGAVVSLFLALMLLTAVLRAAGVVAQKRPRRH